MTEIWVILWGLHLTWLPGCGLILFFSSCPKATHSSQYFFLCKLQPQVRLHLFWKLQKKPQTSALASIRFLIFQLSSFLNLYLPLTCSEILAKTFFFLDLISQISAFLWFTHIKVFFRTPICTRRMEQAAQESESGFVFVYTRVYVCLYVKASETMGN